MDSDASATNIGVFKEIAELKADPEVVKGNMEFYTKNMDIFDENEEEKY